jgi:hypothetical protein
MQARVHSPVAGAKPKGEIDFAPHHCGFLSDDWSLSSQLQNLESAKFDYKNQSFVCADPCATDRRIKRGDREKGADDGDWLLRAFRDLRVSSVGVSAIVYFSSGWLDSQLHAFA